MTLVMGHTIHGTVYEFPHVCPGEDCAIGRWLLCRDTGTSAKRYERRSPDGDGLPMVKGLEDSSAQGDAEDVGGSGTVIPPMVVGDRKVQPARRNQSPSLKPAAGSEPADVHPISKTWPELIAERIK